MRITRHFLTVGNRRVHYTRAGEGPAVCLLHASPCSAIGRTSSLTCATFPFVIARCKMCASSAPLQALLRARQIARHAASCRRRELRLSLASRVSSPKLRQVASMPSPRSTRHTSSIFESISTQTKFVTRLVGGEFVQLDCPLGRDGRKDPQGSWKLSWVSHSRKARGS